MIDHLISFLIGLFMNFQTFMIDPDYILIIRAVIVVLAFLVVLRKTKIKRILLTPDFFALALSVILLSFSYKNVSYFSDNYYLYKVPIYFFGAIIPFLLLRNFFYYSSSEIKKSFIIGFFVGGFLSIFLWIIGLSTFSLDISLMSSQSRYEYSRVLVNPIWLSRIAFSLSIMSIFGIHNGKTLKKIIRIAIVIVTSFLGIITYSRGPFVAFLAVLMIALIPRLRKGRFRISITLLIFLTILLLLITVSWYPLINFEISRSLQYRFSIQQIVNSGRINLWRYVFSKIELNSIFLGNGPYKFSSDLKYPHNIILEMLYETGILGLLSFIFFVFSTIKRRRDMIFTLVFIFYLICALFSGDLNSNFQLFWIAAL